MLTEIAPLFFSVVATLVFEFFRKNKTRGKISEIFGKISEKFPKNFRKISEKLEKFGKIEFEKP